MTKATETGGSIRYGLFRSDIAETYFVDDCLRGKIYDSLSEATAAQTVLRNQLVSNLRKLIVIHAIDEKPIEGKPDDSYILG